MNIELGPHESVGVRIWIAYARTVLADVLLTGRAGTPALSMPIIEAFETYLDQWDDTAAAHSVFTWKGEVDPAVLIGLAQAWFDLAQQLAEEAETRGFPLSPPEGEAFYNTLVDVVLQSFDQLPESDAKQSERLRRFWPGHEGD